MRRSPADRSEQRIVRNCQGGRHSLSPRCRRTPFRHKLVDLWAYLWDVKGGEGHEQLSNKSPDKISHETYNQHRHVATLNLHDRLRMACPLILVQRDRRKLNVCHNTPWSFFLSFLTFFLASHPPPYALNFIHCHQAEPANAGQLFLQSKDCRVHTWYIAQLFASMTLITDLAESYLY